MNYGVASGIIRYIRASKIFSKFRVLRSSVRFAVPCASKFRVGTRNINQTSNMITCHSCVTNFHHRCSKMSTSTYRNNSYCLKCIKSKDIIRYNPYFDSLQHIAHNNSYCLKCIKSKDTIRHNPYFDSLQHSLQDCYKAYLQNQISRNSIEALSPLNAILENCTNKSIEQLKCLENSSPKDQESQNSILCQFLNIDGNLKNFDTCNNAKVYRSNIFDNSIGFNQC